MVQDLRRAHPPLFGPLSRLQVEVDTERWTGNGTCHERSCSSIALLVSLEQSSTYTMGRRHIHPGAHLVRGRYRVCLAEILGTKLADALDSEQAHGRNDFRLENL